MVDVHIPKDRETGRPRGFAFVRFAGEEQAAQAIEQFHGREVGGREIRLDIAEDRPRPPRQRRDGPAPDRYARNDYGGGHPRTDSDDRGGYDHGDYDRGHYDRDGDYDSRSFDKPKRGKGSRRGLRGKKRSL